MRAGMSCREEILIAARTMSRRSDEFSIEEVIGELRRRGSHYSELTIRTHVASRMCSNAPDNHATTYNDLVRVSPGRYRLVKQR